MKDGFYSVAEYAALKGCSKQAVYKRLNNGRLKYVEVLEDGKKVKYIQKEEEDNGINRVDSSLINRGNTENTGVVIAEGLTGSKYLTERLKELNNDKLILLNKLEEKERIIAEKDKTITDLAQRLADIAATQAAAQAAAAAPADHPEEETAAAPAAQQQRGILQRLRSFFSGK